MDKIVSAAQVKFGQVLACQVTDLNPPMEYTLHILRREPAIEHLPYMTIRSYARKDGTVSFYSGDYDLSKDHIYDSQKRLKGFYTKC